MRHMQIIEATDLAQARQVYLDTLARRGIALVPSCEVYVETVHRPGNSEVTWLCYVAMPRPHAA